MGNLFKKIQLLSKLPLFKLGYKSGSPIILPSNITVSLLYRCNSRCHTCNVYTRKADILTLEEFDQIFKSMGKAPFWFTFSGGEPFLRKDIADVIRCAYDHTKPGVINIPTNGLLFERIPVEAEKIISHCKESDVIINLSLDQIGEEHDKIRNVPGNWEKSMKTFKALRELKKYPNFTLGIHTVISNFNVHQFPEFYPKLVEMMGADSFITEIAEERNELLTIGTGITPKLEDYRNAIAVLKKEMRERKTSGVASIASAFRYEYYELVQKILEYQKQVIPCYAGHISCQISAEGEIWPCCIRADSMGNLRDNDYDFTKVWKSHTASKIRTSIKNRECHCPLANASYTNMLVSEKTVAKVVKNLIVKN
ncbi:MAG: hypothetical protein Kow00108_00620 [Calditrichia bacterium]